MMTDTDDTDATIATLEARVKELEDRTTARSILAALARALTDDAAGREKEVADGARAIKTIRSLLKKLAAEKSAFEKQVGEIEQQRKTAGRIYELAIAKQRAAEALEEQACAHALKVGLPDVEYDPRNYKPPGSFTAIEGTTIGQSPIPQPPPVVASEPKPPAMERVTVHVGAGSTLSQEIELPVAATRVRPSKQRGAAA